MVDGDAVAGPVAVAESILADRVVVVGHRPAGRIDSDRLDVVVAVVLAGPATGQGRRVRGRADEYGNQRRRDGTAKRHRIAVHGIVSAIDFALCRHRPGISHCAGITPAGP